MLKRLFKRIAGPAVRPEDLTVTQAIEILARASDDARAVVADKTKDPAILDYLSGDARSGVRALVARNPATPRTVDVVLCDDDAAEVRIELASKIARLLPDLDPGAAETLRDLTLKVLERLAHDHLPRVRQIVAEEIKSSARVPKALVETLARDAQAAVAAPILEYSPLLSDQDLIEVIASGQAEGVLSAIARRDGVSEPVSDAVVATLDIPAVAALLANPSAKVRAEALDTVAEHAEHIGAWHEGLVLRPELSMRAVRRISGFVAVSLLMRLSERHGLDDVARRAVQARVKERLAADDDTDAAEDPRTRARRRAVEAFEAGALDDAFIVEAVRADDRLLASYAIAIKARAPEAVVERVLKARSGALITALCWHAGLSMRTAFVIQKDLARVAGPDIVPARGGTDYPMAPDVMAGHLDLLGIKAE